LAIERTVSAVKERTGKLFFSLLKLSQLEELLHPSSSMLNKSGIKN
jgi:hypothetical protein